MAPVTNFPEGISTGVLGGPMALYPGPDPAKWYEWFDDFTLFGGASSWTITETQAGATQSVGDGGGGVLQLINTAGAADANYIQTIGETVRLVAGKRAAFRARFRLLANVANANIVLGCQVRGAAPLAPTDGVWLVKPTGGATMALKVAKASAALTSAAFGTVLAGVWYTVGWTFDGVDKFVGYFNDASGASIQSAAGWPSTEDLAVTLGVVNADAFVRNLEIDHVFAAVER